MDSLCLRGSALSKKGCPPKAGVDSVARICSAAQAVEARPRGGAQRGGTAEDDLASMGGTRAILREGD